MDFKTFICWQDFPLQIMANSWPYSSQMRQVHSRFKQGTISSVKLELKCPAQGLLHYWRLGVLLLNEWNCTSLKQSSLVLLWWYLLKSRSRTAGPETSLVVQWLRIYLPMQDAALIPGQGTKIPRAAEQPSLCLTTGGLRTTMKSPHKAMKTQWTKKKKVQIKKNSFWSCQVACRILVPWPGIEPVPPAVEVQSFNHWTTNEVPGKNKY